MFENYMCLLEISGRGRQVKLGCKMDCCMKRVENHVLEQLYPTQMAYWAKKYVTMLTRPAHWMTY